LQLITLPNSDPSVKFPLKKSSFLVTGNFLVHLGACSVGNWQLIGVSVGEGLVIEEALTCGFLSYHPRVMGLTVTSSNIENMCSTDWFDNNSLPDSFRCSPCLVNKSLLYMCMKSKVLVMTEKVFILSKQTYVHEVKNMST
jgi:hypothetical protein